MIRGTTPTIILKIKSPDFDMSAIDFVHLSIEDSNGKINKIIENPIIDIEEKTISYHLTQQDTLDFGIGTINVQVKGKLLDGNVFSHNPIGIVLEKIQEEAIL